MPHPSRIISITGPAIRRALAGEREDPQAVLSLTPNRRAPTSPREMAQSVARALLSARFCGRRCLYFQHWVIRKPFGIILFVGEDCRLPARAYARLRRWSRDAIDLDSMPNAALMTNYSRISLLPIKQLP